MERPIYIFRREDLEKVIDAKTIEIFLERGILEVDADWQYHSLDKRALYKSIAPLPDLPILIREEF